MERLAVLINAMRLCLFRLVYFSLLHFLEVYTPCVLLWSRSSDFCKSDICSVGFVFIKVQTGVSYSWQWKISTNVISKFYLNKISGVKMRGVKWNRLTIKNWIDCVAFAETSYLMLFHVSLPFPNRKDATHFKTSHCDYTHTNNRPHKSYSFERSLQQAVAMSLQREITLDWVFEEKHQSTNKLTLLASFSAPTLGASARESCWAVTSVEARQDTHRPLTTRPRPSVHAATTALTWARALVQAPVATLGCEIK